MGARVDSDPSIRPFMAGCARCSRNDRWSRPVRPGGRAVVRMVTAGLLAVGSNAERVVPHLSKLRGLGLVGLVYLVRARWPGAGAAGRASGAATSWRYRTCA